MPNVSLGDLPEVRGLEITSCAVEARENGEARIVYTIKANQKLLALLKKTLPSMEDYAGYKKWHDNSNQLIIIVSCRDGEDAATAAERFTTILLESIQTEIESRNNARAAEQVEEFIPDGSRRDPSPSIHRRPRHYSVR